MQSETTLMQISGFNLDIAIKRYQVVSLMRDHRKMNSDQNQITSAGLCLYLVAVRLVSGNVDRQEIRKTKNKTLTNQKKMKLMR